MVKKRFIIYPFILDCIKYCENEYWKNIFENLSYGKISSPFFINKDLIYYKCKNKNKEFSYKIENKESDILYKEIYTLLSVVINDNINNNKILDIKNYEENLSSISNFNDIKKKSIKDLLIELFVVEMKNKYNLSLKKSRYLLSLIMISIILKTITHKDIVFIDGKIKEIDGIIFSDQNFDIIDEKRNIIFREMSQNNISSSIEDKFMYEKWYKYIDNIKKKLND